jgi:hypothetical protein
MNIVDGLDVETTKKWIRHFEATLLRQYKRTEPKYLAGQQLSINALESCLRDLKRHLYTLQTNDAGLMRLQKMEGEKWLT